MDTAITSAVTQETASAYADFIASLCEPPTRPALRVIEGGLSDAEDEEFAEPVVQARPIASRGEGAKYDKNLNVVEIAKRIRADIKAAITAGTIPAIKTSVRISRYSMGRSIDVTITEAPFVVINPAYTEAYNAGSRVWDLDSITKYTPEALRVLDVVKDIRDAYNHDRSDAMTDYYDTNFGGGVSRGLCYPATTQELKTMKPPFDVNETIHECPHRDSGMTPCCGRTPFELPRTDRMSANPALVNCDRVRLRDRAIAAEAALNAARAALRIQS